MTVFTWSASLALVCMTLFVADVISLYWRVTTQFSDCDIKKTTGRPVTSFSGGKPLYMIATSKRGWRPTLSYYLTVKEEAPDQFRINETVIFGGARPECVSSNTLFTLNPVDNSLDSVITQNPMSKVNSTFQMRYYFLSKTRNDAVLYSQILINGKESTRHNRLILLAEDPEDIHVHPESALRVLNEMCGPVVPKVECLLGNLPVDTNLEPTGCKIFTLEPLKP